VLEDDKDALPGGEEEKLVAGGLTGFIIVNQQPETQGSIITSENASHGSAQISEQGWPVYSHPVQNLSDQNLFEVDRTV